ncbi:conserved hypothetical protein [Leishmania major strain Friedlin]|uniref:Paraflagellar rod component n=1 Tax=Leishmania major TaxID=5664 RepID=Q4QDM4_LEIMA|nr:conserved hypothetical protein [Leishmania major strain Friedlin]CAG9572553.1 hypothetical_protein_-_conserved [Leishmania major strain Friedlin]CAJ04375.1 conserved hypothetical protein [Leishmania major strain Friedlin]|eukprot:XP_001682574.1 conserved hypothetical protein [Leishmania major strain Friedlin]
MSEMNLIVNITCNPPVISIFGPIKESTIDRLNETIPNSCSTTNTGKTPFALVRKEDPPHWFGELRTQFATEDIGTSMLFISVLDALEEERVWKLRGSTSLNHDGNKTTYKFFFVRGAH